MYRLHVNICFFSINIAWTYTMFFLCCWEPHLNSHAIKCRERKTWNEVSPLIDLSQSISIYINVCVSICVQPCVNVTCVGFCVWKVQLWCCVIHVDAGGAYWPALRECICVIWQYTQHQVQLRLFSLCICYGCTRFLWSVCPFCCPVLSVAPPRLCTSDQCSMKCTWPCELSPQKLPVPVAGGEASGVGTADFVASQPGILSSVFVALILCLACLYVFM